MEGREINQSGLEDPSQHQHQHQQPTFSVALAMKRNIIFSILFGIIFFCFFSCRKYDDCSAVSLRSGEAVLLRGVWRIEKYEVNGIDSTDFILSNPNYADVTFKDDGIKGTGGEGSYTSGIFKGYYQFLGANNIDISGYDTLAKSRNAFLTRDSIEYSYIKFHIACLKKEIFWIKADYDPNQISKHTYNKNNYYIKFKNVK